MKQVIALLLFFTTTIMLAQTADKLFVNANALYKDGKYLEAIKNYEAIETTKNVSSELYYNLGNAYYKLNKVAPAIYNYEKALQLNALNEDALNNLIIAKRLTLDRIEELPQSIFQKINENFLQKFTYNTWATLVVILSFLATALFLLFYFSFTPSKKRLFFITSNFSFLLLIVGLVITYSQYNQSKNTVEAIIFSEEVEITNEPTKDASEIFTLHEGTKVKIIDTVDKWNKIKLTDGKTGWMLSENLKSLNKF
ncbi:tetratricopeptide repeat protein [Tenacibaculum retecalamus]|uniref:tetratricopeptide repeat protein n=1 Tax=Tenacibaculum retecalamus TaxID=3018315 RepID=UPI0023D90263|nr:tetratricopeptide repeat protein [Tenacibaculum retecalamus]WBX71450.1 tetratricopeptide repeat protein [Tenacibaculum retecalamus]